MNRLYKVTAYHHKDREALRDAQLKVELHLEHINQQTKGYAGATNKIWKRIYNLSAPMSSMNGGGVLTSGTGSRRSLISAEDIGYIKLRKTALELLKWDRDETQFIHSDKLNFAPLNEYLVKQKMKPMRYMPAHAVLLVLGKPNWKYRPDLVKSTLDSRLLTPTPGGMGIREAALLLFREKNGRFVPCHEPLLLSNCVFSNDCSQFNIECPVAKCSGAQTTTSTTTTTTNSASASAQATSWRAAASERSRDFSRSGSSFVSSGSAERSVELSQSQDSPDNSRGNSTSIDAESMTSTKSLPNDTSKKENCAVSATPPSSRSYSLTSSALPVNNKTIINHIMNKMNNYHISKQQQSPATATQLLANKSAQMKGGEPVSACQHPTVYAEIKPSLATEHSNGSSCSSSSSSCSKSPTPNGHTANSEPLSHAYNHHLFFHNHHGPYGDFEESFEVHERLSKESLLLRADTPMRTRYWLQILRYHAKDLGHWRCRRNGFANIMVMHQN